MTWTQEDPRLKSPHPSTYPWYGLPDPSSPSAKVKVSLIPTIPITGPSGMMCTYSKDGEEVTVPAYGFLIEKEGGPTLLWDLGMRSDPENAPRMTQEGALKFFRAEKGHRDCISYLEEKGYDVNQIELLVLSHVHFDHYGNLDTLPNSNKAIILGHGSLEVIGKGEPAQDRSPWPTTWTEKNHLVEFPPVDTEWHGEASTIGRSKAPSSQHRKWERLGCFEKAVDWYGDGSLWFIDTPGHLQGHLMALARVTTDEPTYILLSGDASHDQTQYLPAPNTTDPQEDKRSPIPIYNGEPAFALDPDALAYTIGQMTRMSQEEDIMVLMAHEKEAEGVLPPYPEDLGGWKQKGWKEEKDKTQSVVA